MTNDIIEEGRRPHGGSFESLVHANPTLFSINNMIRKGDDQ